MRAMVLAAASAVRPRNRDDRRRDRQRNQPGRLTPITDEKNRHPVRAAVRSAAAQTRDLGAIWKGSRGCSASLRAAQRPG